MPFTINRYSLGIICDLRKLRPIGTGFAFLKPNWIVTAAHVVFDDYGDPRDRVGIHLTDHGIVLARVAMRHPTIDVAVLTLVENTPCEIPLFPSYVGFASALGLAAAGYSPSRTLVEDDLATLTIHFGEISTFERELRERTDDNEEAIVFPAPFAEPGNSGGPVFAWGGGVVGVVTEMFQREGTRYARATSILSLLQGIDLCAQWPVKNLES